MSFALVLLANSILFRSTVKSRDRPSLAQELGKGGLGIRERHDMRDVVLGLLKVEIVLDGMVSSLLRAMEDNLHIEFTPSFLCDHERNLLNS